MSQYVIPYTLPAHVLLLRAADTWSMASALSLAVGVARGLAHLHLRGVCHGGLTPGAVRVGKDGHAVVCDVALPVESGVGRAGASPGHYVGGVGTHHAPELAALAYGGAGRVSGAGRGYTRESDVWSLGLVVHGLVAGLGRAEAEAGTWGPVWRRADDADGSGGASPHPFPPYTRPDWSRLPPADTPAVVRSLLARMLSVAPGERPSAEAVALELEAAARDVEAGGEAAAAAAGGGAGAGAGKA
jgi:serine/threonine protein kinase